MNPVIETPVDLVEALADLRFPEKADRRFQELMDRNNEGALTQDEKADLEAMVELSQTMSLLRARALHLLGRKPQ